MTTKSTSVATGTTMLPLNQLRLDEKANVRHANRGAQQDFVASIKAIGVKMPLLVRPNGTGYLVTDGGKRLAALQELVKQGALAKDVPVPVIVADATDAAARETSLALNIVRAAMHPVDEFRAFAALHSDKLAAETIAERFGVSTRIVRQRLALGSLDDVILNAWLKGEIKSETAEAFTLLPEKKDQAQLYAKLHKKMGRVERYYVKEAIKDGTESVGRFLNAVGVEAYEARGGKVTRDLFGNDHVVSDPKLVTTMVTEKLEETCKRLVEQDGWAWATHELPENRYDYGHPDVRPKPTPEERKRLEELQAMCEDEELAQDEIDNASDEFDRLEAEIRARAFTAKVKAKAGCFVGLSQDGSISIEYGRTKPVAKKAESARAVDPITGKKKANPNAKKAPAALSQALERRLKEQREKAIKAALVDHPHGNPLASLLAGVVAAQINPGSWNAAPHAVLNKLIVIADGIAPKVMNAALRKAFDAKDYFENAPKSFTLAAIAEAVNADEARKLNSKKRPEMAKFAVSNVVKTGWLPKELRTANYDGPQKKAAKPTAKSAKRKRK